MYFEQEASVKLFFTPEDGDDLQNKAKRHFLLTGVCWNFSDSEVCDSSPKNKN